ncbi:unnamed protein product [Caenorhabditis angaria]|uniref:Domain of unknown function DB domain-containing protein n=1 Tax=Caenorhabditis angaria TaxID=860376 RepID=A0A9P1IWU4_9PELO|nr:unnamed protein product [Caenorhabditis angaria]
MFNKNLVIFLFILKLVNCNAPCMTPPDFCTKNPIRRDVIDCMRDWQCREGYVCYFGACHNINDEMHPFRAQSIRTYFPDEEATEDNERFEHMLSTEW